MSDDKNGFTEHLSASSEPGGVVQQQRRSGRFKRHCGRFWWLYALLIVITVLVSVLLMSVEYLYYFSMLANAALKHLRWLPTPRPVRRRRLHHQHHFHGLAESNT